MNYSKIASKGDMPTEKNWVPNRSLYLPKLSVKPTEYSKENLNDFLVRKPSRVSSQEYPKQKLGNHRRVLSHRIKLKPVEFK